MFKLFKKFKNQSKLSIRIIPMLFFYDNEIKRFDNAVNVFQNHVNLYYKHTVIHFVIDFLCLYIILLFKFLHCG